MNLRSIVEAGRKPIPGQISFGSLICSMWGVLTAGIWFALFVEAQAEHGIFSSQAALTLPWIFLSVLLVFGGQRVFEPTPKGESL